MEFWHSRRRPNHLILTLSHFPVISVPAKIVPESGIFRLSFTNFFAKSAIGEIVEEGAFLAEKFKEFVENYRGGGSVAPPSSSDSSS